MTAEENLVVLGKILNGIRDNNLNEVMSELGFEVQSSNDKSTTWLAKEPNEVVDESEKVYEQHMMVRYNCEPHCSIKRFANTDTAKDFIQYVRDNAHNGVVSVDTITSDPEKRIVYK